MYMARRSRRPLILDSRKNEAFVLGSIIASVVFIVISNIDISYAQNFSNYTSERYHVQFQYPSTWEVTEKMGRFDEGVDLKIMSPSLYTWAMIIYSDDLISSFGSRDLISAVYDSFKTSIDDYSYDYTIVEQPAFNTTIDGKKAGTFLYAWKDKYEDYAQRWGTQDWIVFDGSRGYLISYIAPASEFDNPENTIIRDQFIKSIKFPGQSNSTNANTTNRFAE